MDLLGGSGNIITYCLKQNTNKKLLSYSIFLENYEFICKAEIMKLNLHKINTIKLDGIISRRINIQHWLVYQLYESPFTERDIEYCGIIKIIRMWTHYDDVR